MLPVISEMSSSTPPPPQWGAVVFFIHKVYVDWNIACIRYSPKCNIGHLWDFIWWYAPCSIYIHDVYVDWNVPYQL